MIRGTVSELLKLSQEDNMQPVPMSMSVLLDRAISVEQEALQNVQIRRHAATEGVQVLASPRLVEALAYILRNAGQASAPGDGVQIAVRPAGGTVQLWIIDEGDGIDEADLPRVMEPLFTTRPLGEGLGLGLPTAESIIRSLGGSLVITNRHRRAGTVATITLKSAGPQRSSLFGAEEPMAVLIVDDEPRVARALGRLLHGHSVTTAASGREALQHLSGEFDLIICDLLMPIMTGMELFERFKAERPELAERFLFTTGGAWSDASRRFIAKHADRIVTKPFHRERLEQAIAFIRR